MDLSKPLILIDGSSYLYRAFHALPPLTNSKGQPTGAVFGVINMIRKLITEYKPTQLAVVFDAKGKTFRDDIYTEYKANRPPMPDDLRSQIEPLHNLVKAMGLPLLIIDDVEADDVIATLAIAAAEKGQPVLISTGDKDIAQLVNEHITLINTMTNTTLDCEGVIKKFGVAPEQIIDYLTLIGDTSDNVPGVEKVGPKTAVKWLQNYGTLENIIQSADEVKGKVGENLRNALPQLPISKQLITLKTDVALEQTIEDLAITEPELDTLIECYKQMEFKSLLNECLSQQQAQTARSNDYQTILTIEELDEWLKRLQQAPLFSFDTETTSLNYMDARLVGFSFAINPGEAAYLPFGHDYEGAPEQLKESLVLEKFKPILENPDHKKIGQHLKYDANVLANYGITLQGIEYDTMLESYVYNSTVSRHDMDSLALKYLGRQTIHFEDIAGKGAKQLTFNQIPLEKASNYAAEDADITLQLHQHLWPKLQQENKLQRVFSDIEIPLISVLAKIEQTGVLIDEARLTQQSDEIATRLKTLIKEAHQIAGEEFNLDSPKQLREIFFEKLGLPIVAKTPTGQPSTAEPVLQDMAHEFELPRLILEYRGLRKLKSTYTDRLPEQINQKTGRVHTSYHQAIAATGRLSSSDPNLQNIPVRTAEGRRIRQAFIAPPNYKIVAADYSQIELRIMAHLSQDPGLLRAFAENLDIHKATAAEVFGTTLENVSAEQRRNAKAINFGLIYGMSSFGLAKQLEIPRQEAQDYIDSYFMRYPKVKIYMETTRAKAHELGYVETLFGRRLYLQEINTRNMQRQKAAERMAINAPMQGTAADIIKRAMLHTAAKLEGIEDARMIMQVHDELVFEIHENKVEELIPLVRDCMSQAASLDVPLVVDVGIGDNWDEAH